MTTVLGKSLSATVHKGLGVIVDRRWQIGGAAAILAAVLLTVFAR